MMRRAPALVLLAMTMLMAVVGCRGRPGPPAAGDASADAVAPDPELVAWRADLSFVVAELRRRHPAPFHHTSEAAFAAAVDAFTQALPGLDRSQRVAGLARIVALVHDAHTQVSLGRLDRLLRFPLRIRWFPEGLIVTAVTPSRPWAVGARLTAVGGVPIDDAVARLTKTIGYQAEGYLHDHVADRLASAVFLRGVGLIATTGPARYDVVDGAGVARVLELDVGQLSDSPVTAVAPLTRQHPERHYWSQYVPAHDAVYVQYRDCNPDPGHPFAGFAAEVAATLDAHPRARLVIDLRDNRGGDSRVVEPLLEVVAARPRLRTAALIGRSTFSSGILAAISLDRLGAVLIGEPAGSPATMYGQTELVKLPGTGLKLQYSTKFFEFSAYPGPALAPDVPVTEHAADHLGGRDAALERALTMRLPAR